MRHVKCMSCRECGNEYPVEPRNVCELCFGPLEIRYDYDSIARSVSRASIEKGPVSMWRYDGFLPVAAEAAVDIGTGFTPLVRAKNLGRMLGLDHLYIKNDAVNPTYSFKDRPVSVTTSKALEFEFDVLACVSTGNLMGSVAAHGAKAGMETIVFFPASLEREKIVGAAVYGPTLVAIEGTYDQANPVLQRTGRHQAMGLRQHQHAAVLRGGEQDPGLRGRGAAWVEGARSLRGPGRFGRAAHEDMEGHPGDGGRGAD